MYQMEEGVPIFYRVSRGDRASLLGLKDLNVPMSNAIKLSDEAMRTAMGLHGAVSSRFRYGVATALM